MARIVADRVQETSTTTGTGAYTLGGATLGFRAASAVCANGDTFSYHAEDSTGNWETGLGTWGTGGILTRTTIYASTNANAAVSWAVGVRKISLSLLANASLGPTLVTGDVNVSGSLYAATKSFLIDHPTKEGMKLQYGSLESPYHGVRLTGEAQITRGVCTVELPDYIKGLCKQEGSQVQITNYQHGKTLWVEDINVESNNFTIACDVGIFDDKAYKFFWSFTAVRKDIEDLVVEA